MNSHIQHLHYQAQLAELKGFPNFAASIRSELAKALLEFKGAVFFKNALPVIENNFPPCEYLAKAKKCECGNDLGPAHACIPSGRDVLDKITAHYTMFGKLSSNPKFPTLHTAKIPDGQVSSP